MVTTTAAEVNTGETRRLPIRDVYTPPSVRSPEWNAEFRRAAEECYILLWAMAQAGRFKDAEELSTVAAALKLAMQLQKLASEKLSQTGYQL